MRGGRPKAWQTRGCSSPAWPSSCSPTEQPRRTGPGARASGRAASTVSSTPELVGEPRGRRRSRRTRRRPGPRPTSRSARARRTSTTARNSGCSGSGLEQLGQLGVAWGASRRRRSAPARARTGTRPCRSRRARRRAHRGRGCARRAQQPGQQRGGVAPAPRWRAGWPAGRCARRTSSAGRPSASRAASPTNGKLSTSTQPAPASVRPIRRRSRCSRVSPRPAAGVRQHGRHVVVADDPGDLLDQVVGVGQVGPPGRRRRRRRASRAGSTAQPTASRCATAVSASIVDAGDPGGQVVGHPDRAAGRAARRPR